MFCDFHIAKTTISHNFGAHEHLTNERMVFVFDAIEVDVVCRYWLVLFVHVTILKIIEVLIYELCIPCVEVTFLVRLFLVGFDAEHLGVGDIPFDDSRWLRTRSCDLLSSW